MLTTHALGNLFAAFPSFEYFDVLAVVLVLGLTLQQILTLPQDRMLSNVAIEFQPVGLIADQVLDVIPVNFETAGYYIFDDTNFNIPEAKRAPRAVYKEIEFGVTSDTYRAEEYGLEARIDDRERRNAPGALDPDIGKTRRLTNGVLLNRERRVANLVTNTANVTQNTTLTGAAQWSDPTSDPAVTARLARKTIRTSTGVLPNQLTMGWEVYEALRIHPKVIDYMDGGRAGESDLAEYFEVERVVVAKAIYNTAKEGQAATLTDLWGRDALFHFRSPVVAADEPSFGYQFEAMAMGVFRYRDVPVNCDIIRVNEIRAEKIASTRLGYLVKTAVAAV
jgi:hypothetical protein